PAGARAALVAAVVAGAGDAEPLRRVYTHSLDAKVRRECLRGFELAGADDLVALVLWDETGALRAEAVRLTVELALAAADEARFAEATSVLEDRLVAEPDEYVAGELRTALARLPQPDPLEESEAEAASEAMTEEPAPGPGDGDDATL
ncbi:MAG TPA: hypothetical protein DCZ72_11210, partial [Armatimonadetes bacterium]|nr:hypothetical protein [Armatimonadota bacterium]